MKKDLLTDATGMVGLASITVGAGLAELWVGLVVGGLCALFVSNRMEARK